MLNPNASPYKYTLNMASNLMSEALERLKRCQISGKDYEMTFPFLGEWHSSNTLNNVLEIWETHNKAAK